VNHLDELYIFRAVSMLEDFNGAVCSEFCGFQEVSYFVDGGTVIDHPKSQSRVGNDFGIETTEINILASHR